MTTPMITPVEFDPEFIRAQCEPDQQMYFEENHTQEPMRSVLENNPDIYFVPPKRGTEWGQ